jgi:hypothetical protein
MRKIMVTSVVALALAIVGATASIAAPSPRIDMKVLLLSATGNEPTTAAWEATLKREGVPYDSLVATPGHTPYTADTFADTLPDGTPRAKYQAVIVATGGLVYQNDSGQFVSALSTDEWQTLATYEATYGIRQVTGVVYPTPEYGLNYPTVSGDQGGVVGSLTAAGKLAFPYLNGPVPIEKGAYGYQATPASATAANFQTLVAGPSNAALLGVYTRSDGRQEMVSTVDANPYQLHNMLLRHGMLNWVTRGVYFGSERYYMTVHVDDVFLSSDHWDTTTHAETTTNPIRMNAKDEERAKDWSVKNRFRIDLLINASGSDAMGKKDGLTQSLVQDRAYFGWVNHTYSGEPNNDTDYQHVVDDIQQNLDWAKARKVAMDPSELVFDEHSGYNNPNVFPALAATGVKWVGDDASRFPDQRPWGSALSVPRYPSSIYYNVGTRAQMLDEYNYRYLPPSLGGICQDNATTTCFTQPATWNQLMDSEVGIMMRHVLGNDPRPHYVHQANLAQDAVLLVVMDELLKRYRAYFNPVLLQPTLKGEGQLLQTQAQWAANSGQVTGYLQGGKVYITSAASSTVQFPLAGANGVGSAYGGQVSGWGSIAPGATLTFSPAP